MGVEGGGVMPLAKGLFVVSPPSPIFMLNLRLSLQEPSVPAFAKGKKRLVNFPDGRTLKA